MTASIRSRFSSTPATSSRAKAATSSLTAFWPSRRLSVSSGGWPTVSTSYKVCRARTRARRRPLRIYIAPLDHGQAAVDGEDVARDIGGLLRGQEGRRRPYLLRPGGPPPGGSSP